MAIDPAWRDFAALWGAALSTLIVLVKLLPARPRFHLEPGEPPSTDLTLKVVNPAQHICFVRERFRLHLTGNENALGIYTGKSKIEEIGTPGSLWAYVEGEGKKDIRINCIINRHTAENNRWLVCFTWDGGWLLPISFPLFVYISTKRAKRINAAI